MRSWSLGGRKASGRVDRWSDWWEVHFRCSFPCWLLVLQVHLAVVEFVERVAADLVPDGVDDVIGRRAPVRVYSVDRCRRVPVAPLDVAQATSLSVGGVRLGR